MTPLAFICAVMAVLACVIWSSRHLRISREKRHGQLLTPTSPAELAGAPVLSVLVAARDEEQNIAPCIESLLAQEYPELEIIAVNDRSRDRTGAILDELARQEPRLTVLHVNELPDGWTGKNHAMHLAAARARGELLLCTDADCRFDSPRALSIAVCYMQQTEAGMVSVLPRLETPSWWESLIQPVCSGVMMIWYAPEVANDPARPAAYANGAMMLFAHSVYDRLGGHEALADCVQEDMALARRVKSMGLGLRVIRNDGLYRVRMYSTPGDMLRGWTRILRGSLDTIRMLGLTIAAVIFAGMGPVALAGAGLAMGLTGQSRPIWLAAGLLGMVATVIQMTVIWRFYSLLQARRWLFWSYPLGCIVVLGVLLNCLLARLTGSAVTWKGTAYPAARSGR